MWTLSTHRLHTPLQDAIDQNLGSGSSKIKRTEHIFPTAEEVGSLMVKATLPRVKVQRSISWHGTMSGCQTENYRDGNNPSPFNKPMLPRMSRRSMSAFGG